MDVPQMGSGCSAENISQVQGNNDVQPQGQSLNRLSYLRLL